MDQPHLFETVQSNSDITPDADNTSSSQSFRDYETRDSEAWVDLGNIHPTHTTVVMGHASVRETAKVTEITPVLDVTEEEVQDSRILPEEFYLDEQTIQNGKAHVSVLLQQIERQAEERRRSKKQTFGRR